MAWVDRWSLLMVIFLLIQALISIHALRYRDVSDEDEGDDDWDEFSRAVSHAPLASPVFHQNHLA
jgi:hypothetical protein